MFDRSKVGLIRWLRRWQRTLVALGLALVLGLLIKAMLLLPALLVTVAAVTVLLVTGPRRWQRRREQRLAGHLDVWLSDDYLHQQMSVWTEAEHD